MIKRVHIHSDKKFLDASTRIKHGFDTTIYFLTDNEIQTVNKNIISINPTFKNIKSIINKCNQADEVYLFEFNLAKRFIVSQITNPNTKVFLHLFGYEFYSCFHKDFLSSQTLKLIKRYKCLILLVRFVRIFKKTLSLLKQKSFFLLFKINLLKNISTLFNKVDAIIITSLTEYELISQYWDNVPRAIISPIACKYNNKHIINSDKHPRIILGNSRNYWNNHIDMIDLVKSAKNNSNYDFYLLFNYGDASHYSKAIRKAVANINNFHLVENFMNKDDFHNFYSKTSALVINSYRQLALGNIFTALSSGVKVYLNKKNTTYKWLKDEGFEIFDINNLKKDINNNDVALTHKQMLYNQKQVNVLAKKHSLKEFHRQIALITKSNKNDKKNN